MKAWYKSKTVWFNLLVIATSISQGFGDILPALGPVLSPGAYQWTLFVVGALGLSLRAITAAPIDWKDSE